MLETTRGSAEPHAAYFGHADLPTPPASPAECCCNPGWRFPNDVACNAEDPTAPAVPRGSDHRCNSPSSRSIGGYHDGDDRRGEVAEVPGEAGHVKVPKMSNIAGLILYEVSSSCTYYVQSDTQ